MTRLYYYNSLETGSLITLDLAQSHYLKNVLRLNSGDCLTIFNEREGEWNAAITNLAKTGITVLIQAQVRRPCIIPDTNLLFAPLKNDALTFLVEKATELGVHAFYPVQTERANIDRVNRERLLAIATGAAQQCERLDIPYVHPLVTLNKRLETWPADYLLYVCQERGEALAVRQALHEEALLKAAFLVGPEGGFAKQEIDYLKTLSFVRFVGLGARILRSETAAIAVLSCYQALAGDWQQR